jgi:hypothetical protein
VEDETIVNSNELKSMEDEDTLDDPSLDDDEEPQTVKCYLL